MNNSSNSIEKAGAIILNQNGTKAVLLYRGNHNDWSFPKGHVEPGENQFDTMLREIKEETGVIGKVISPLPDMEYLNSKGDGVRLHMYLLRAETEKLIEEHEGDKLEWIDLNEVTDKLTYQNLKGYFSQQLAGIRKIKSE